MKAKLRFQFFLYLFLFVFISCATQQSTSQNVPISTNASNSSVIQKAVDLPLSEYHELAYILSGISVPTEKYKSILESHTFKSHKKEMDNFWSQVKKQNYEKIQIWRKENLKEVAQSDTAFYPLSGADFFNLYSFYPNSKKYIMVALEKPGNLKDLSSLNRSQLSSGLNSVRSIFASIAYWNYFTRKGMKTNFSNPYFSGAFPVILMFMARFDLKIHSVEFVTIADSGDVVVQKDESKNMTGVKIQFSNSDNFVQELIYFQLRLFDKHSLADNPEGKFFNKLKNTSTILKSAEYLYHNHLTQFRSKMIDFSSLFITDDSGVPYKCFSTNEWDSHLYGSYLKPIYLKGIFKPDLQNDLVHEMKVRAKPLPFPYGYGVLKGSKRSNLLVFKRKPSNESTK